MMNVNNAVIVITTILLVSFTGSTHGVSCQVTELSNSGDVTNIYNSSNCASCMMVTGTSPYGLSLTQKACAPDQASCVAGTQSQSGVTITTTCCQTDFCNRLNPNPTAAPVPTVPQGLRCEVVDLPGTGTPAAVYNTSSCSSCMTMTGTIGSTTVTQKSCVQSYQTCVPDSQLINGVTVITRCCYTDFCNGVGYKSGTGTNQGILPSSVKCQVSSLSGSYSYYGTARSYNSSNCAYCMTVVGSSRYTTVTVKSCVSQYQYCIPDTQRTAGMTITTSCCQSDFCNGLNSVTISSSSYVIVTLSVLASIVTLMTSSAS